MRFFIVLYFELVKSLAQCLILLLKALIVIANLTYHFAVLLVRLNFKSHTDRLIGWDLGKTASLVNNICGNTSVYLHPSIVLELNNFLQCAFEHGMVCEQLLTA